MKKMILGLAAIAAGSVMAIESANIVGYQNFEMDVENGQYCLPVAPQFSAIGNEGAWNFTDKIFNNDAVGGDIVQNFNTDMWDMESWMFKGFSGQSNLGWVYSYNDAWTGDPIDEIIAGFEVVKGDVLFFSPSDGISGATVAGEVADVTNGVKITFPDSNCYNIVNPYPVATTLADLETFCKPGDIIQVFDADAWDIVSYMYKGEGEWAYSYNDAWTGDAIDEIVTDSSTVVMKPGQGGYFNAADEEGRTWNVSIAK